LLKIRPACQLVGDARPRRIDQVEERQPHPAGRLLDADDLLHRPRPPGTGLHRRVVGHDRHRAPVHAADAGDHAVGGQVAGRGVGVQAVLDELLAAVIAEQRDALATEQLPGRRVALVVLGGAAAPHLVGQRLQIVAS